jgi:hypothetical protein
MRFRVERESDRQLLTDDGRRNCNPPTRLTRKSDARTLPRVVNFLAPRRAFVTKIRRGGRVAVELTGPSVARSGAAYPEGEPQWLARSVCRRFELPQAACGCLTRGCDPIQPFRCWALRAVALRAAASKRSPRGPETDVEGGG